VREFRVLPIPVHTKKIPRLKTVKHNSEARNRTGRHLKREDGPRQETGRGERIYLRSTSNQAALNKNSITNPLSASLTRGKTAGRFAARPTVIGRAQRRRNVETGEGRAASAPWRKRRSRKADHSPHLHK
jgi:hypothetical protein